MALQTQVNLYRALGVDGAKATPNQSIYTPINYIAGEGGVTAGSFAFMSTDYPDTIAANNGEGTLLGFVERVISAAIYDVTTTGSLVYPEGTPLTIAVKGDYYVTAPASVAVGDSVLYNSDTGVIGSEGVDSGWVYKTAGDAGDVVVISNW